jgi:hypothetical protein
MVVGHAFECPGEAMLAITATSSGLTDFLEKLGPETRSAKVII